MIRSPPNLRPRGKTEPSANRKVQRSLSVNSAPELDRDGEMSPPHAQKVNTEQIEACISKHLASGAFLDGLAKKLTDHLKKIVEDAVAAALNTALEKISELSAEVGDLRTRVDVLQGNLELRSDDLEQYTRRTNLRVFGIPEAQGEDTDDLVMEVFKRNLKIDLPKESIDRSHRVGRQPRQPEDAAQQRHRAIIVRFTSYRDRRRIFDAKKHLKGSGITIREDLTAYRLKVFQQACSIHGVRRTWTVDGRTKWITGEGSGRDIHSATRLSEVQ